MKNEKKICTVPQAVFRKRIFALDIGGTRLKYGMFVCGETGEISELSGGEVDSLAGEGVSALTERVFSVCDAESFDLLGISSAGMIGRDGSVLYANGNIPGYTGYPLSRVLGDRYGVPVYVQNDIAAGALAEVTKTRRDFYYLSLGTGIGGILIQDGMPLVGEHGIAGQIGYLPSRDGTDCMDRAASVSGLCRRGGDTRALFDAAAAGDGNAVRILSDWAKEVMHVLSFVIGFYDPARIVIGGGISRQGERLLEVLRREEDDLPLPYRKKCRLEVATHGGRSGVLGAAVYALRRWQKESAESTDTPCNHAIKAKKGDRMMEKIKEKIKGGLIVSCQALEDEPMHGSFIMGRFAKAAEEGGAVGIRANTEEDIAEIKRVVSLPVIGIVKREYADSEVYITPTLKEVDEVVRAGAEICALDATKRSRPGGVTLAELVREIRKKYPALLLMADTSDFEEMKAAEALGFDFLGTTMRGYTEDTRGISIPDFDLIRRAAEELHTPIIAEGGILEPSQLSRALSSGAYAAVIGGAITRPQNITKRFVDAIQKR